VNLSTFVAELKRRNVYKVAVAYAVAGWALSQGIAQVFSVFDIPNWAVSFRSQEKNRLERVALSQ